MINSLAKHKYLIKFQLKPKSKCAMYDETTRALDFGGKSRMILTHKSGTDEVNAFEMYYT